MSEEAAIPELEFVTVDDIGLTVWRRMDDGTLAECEIVAVFGQQVRITLPDGREASVPRNRIELV